MKGDHKFSWLERARSFKYAFSGMKILLRDEHNARLHVAAASLAIILSIICEISATQWCIVIMLIGAVFALEAVNSAIEAICDKTSPEIHPLVRKAKDVAAAAVLFMALAALCIAAIIFIPKIF